MSRQRIAGDGSRQAAGDDARRRLLAGAPVTERRLELAGVSTAVLEGGDGPPVVLLHGQGGWAGMWLPVMADAGGGPTSVDRARPAGPRRLAGDGGTARRRDGAALARLSSSTGPAPPRRCWSGRHWAAPSPPGSRPPTATASPGWC